MIHLERLQNIDNTEIVERIKGIFEESFPENERRDFTSLLDLIANNTRFFFYLIRKESSIAGIIAAWEFTDFRYIEYLAVDKDQRGGGIGKTIMENLLKQSPLPVVLEVEKPEDEISIRRIGFYERIGFTHWNLPYIQPAYSELKKAIPLDLMSYGKIDLEQNFERIKKELYAQVYNQTESC